MVWCWWVKVRARKLEIQGDHELLNEIFHQLAEAPAKAIHIKNLYTRTILYK